MVITALNSEHAIAIQKKETYILKRYFAAFSQILFQTFRIYIFSKLSWILCDNIILIKIYVSLRDSENIRGTCDDNVRYVNKDFDDLGAKGVLP